MIGLLLEDRNVQLMTRLLLRVSVRCLRPLFLVSRRKQSRLETVEILLVVSIWLSTVLIRLIRDLASCRRYATGISMTRILILDWRAAVLSGS